MNITHQLKQEEEYITLVNLLKVEDVISSGGEVKVLLENNEIVYNGDLEYRKKKKCFRGDVIEIPTKNTIINII